MNARLKIRDVCLVLAGVAGLLLKRWFADSVGELAYSYLGNLAVSFAIYYLVSMASGARLHRAAVAITALLVVQIYELADGFGFMTNVVDPFDYLANALGVAVAYAVDVVSARLIGAGSGSLKDHP